jgi:hypothetical protein
MAHFLKFFMMLDDLSNNGVSMLANSHKLNTAAPSTTVSDISIWK